MMHSGCTLKTGSGRRGEFCDEVHPCPPLVSTSDRCTGMHRYIEAPETEPR